MAYQTLYRKYRPRKFEFVYGQDNIVKTLQNAIKKSKINHAYLFTGPRGTGKTSCAKLFAKSINCLNNINGDACDNCDNCIAFNKNNNPDIIEIDAASNNGVDEIREIKSKVNLVPSMSKYKVYIIDEVHMLSMGAFNALLKTLEEPPDYVIFILATTEPQKLPNTVISRCQRYDFKNISLFEMKKCLMNIAKQESINITDEALNEISNISSGGMRDAIGMLEQAHIYSNDIINIEDIEILTGNVSNSELLVFFNELLNCNYDEIIKKIDNYEMSGKDFLVISQKLLNFSHKLLIAKKTNNENFLSNLEKETIRECSDTKLYLIIDLLNETINELKKNYQKKLTFEIRTIQIMDGLSLKKSNVPRETLQSQLMHEEKNVPRETLKSLVETKQKKSEIEEKIFELKNVRINNILKESTKKDIEFINELWKNISDFLTNEDYKIISGILLEGLPVAASPKGIIVTFPTESLLKKIEKYYDLSKEIIKKVYENNYKIVYITEEFWKKIRPQFVIKAKNNELELQNEENLIKEINNIINHNSINEFDDLIEMEEK